MQTNPASLHRFRFFFALALASATLIPSASAQTYYWGGTTGNLTGTGAPVGGAGTWSTFTNWTENGYSGTPSGNSFVALNNAVTSNIVLGGASGGNISLAPSSNTVGDFRVDTAGYVLVPANSDRVLNVSSFSGSQISNFVIRTGGGNRTIIISPNAGTTPDFGGILADNSATQVLSLSKGGVETLTLSGTNSSYTGTTSVPSGELKIASIANGNSNSSIGASGNAAANLTLGSGSNNGVLTYIGSGNSTDRLFTMSGTGGRINNDGAGTLNFTNNGTIARGSEDVSRVLTLGGNNTGNNTFAPVLANPTTSGTNRLVKAGAGTWDLTGIHTYTGNTTVSAGTLLVSGSGSVNSSSGVIVDSSTARFRYDSTTALTRNVAVTAGATFAYNSSGDYTGTLTLTNGKLGGTNWNGTVLGGRTIGANQTIAPGNSVGTANTTSQTWDSLGSFDWEINKADGTAGLTAGGWDLLNLSSTLTISATSGSRFTINILSLGLDNLPGNANSFVDLTSYNWLFADSASAISGFSADNFTLNTSGFTNTFTGTFGIALGDTISGGDDTQLYITYTAVPEPSTWLLLTGGLTALVVFRRRRTA